MLGGVNVYILPLAGAVVSELFAVELLEVFELKVILWKLVAVAPVKPADAEDDVPAVPYRSSILPVVSYNQTWNVPLAAEVRLRGLVTDH